MAWNRQKTVALVVLLLATAVAGVFIYWRVGVEQEPGDYQVRKGNYRLEDGSYREAIREFELALERNPDHAGARLGIALTLLQSGRNEESLEAFDDLLRRVPGLAVGHANRGVLLDRMGRHEEALADYRRALELQPELGKGPGWLWRFMRNIDSPPPTIRDRALYIERELAKPPAERLLSLPQEDSRQRMYPVK